MKISCFIHKINTIWNRSYKTYNLFNMNYNFQHIIIIFVWSHVGLLSKLKFKQTNFILKKNRMHTYMYLQHQVCRICGKFCAVSGGISVHKSVRFVVCAIKGCHCRFTDANEFKWIWCKWCAEIYLKKYNW